MSYSQLPQLHLRGSLINVTAKELTEEQKETINDLVEEIWNDPDLQGHKYSFCEALRTTIGGEYKDREKAEQEARIAIWRTCVSVLYHDKKITSNEREVIISKSIQRSKYFKTWIMNYLRQILRENKIPAYKNNPVEVGYPPYVALKVIKSFIEFKRETVEESLENDKFILDNINQRTWPLALTIDVNKIADYYRSFGVEFLIANNKIEIWPNSEDQQTVAGKLIKMVRVKEASLDQKTDDEEGGDSLRFTLEHKIYSNSEEKPDYRTLDEDDQLTTIRSRVPENIKEIFDIIVSTPQDFIAEYGNKAPKKTQIAKYLKRSTKEVDEAFRMFRNQVRALGMAES